MRSDLGSERIPNLILVFCNHCMLPIAVHVMYLMEFICDSITMFMEMFEMITSVVKGIPYPVIDTSVKVKTFY